MKKKKKSLTPAQRQAILESLKEGGEVNRELEKNRPGDTVIPAGIETTTKELKKIGVVLVTIITILIIVKIIEIKTPYLNDFSKLITQRLGL